MIVFPVHNNAIRSVGNFLIRWVQWSCFLVGLAGLAVFLVVRLG